MAWQPPSPLMMGFERGADGGPDPWNSLAPGGSRGPLELDPRAEALGQQFAAIKAQIEARSAPPLWNPDNPVGTETVQSVGMPQPTTYAGPVGQFINPSTGQMTEQGAARLDNPALGFDTGGIGGMAKDLAGVKKAWDALNLDHHVYENGNTITLSKIVVPESARNTGVGTQAMQQLIDYADQTGKQIALTPDKAFGATSMSRLTDFYKQLGFTPNKGRSRDFTTKETMIRNPRRSEQ